MKKLITALLILAAIPAWGSYKPEVDVVQAFVTTNNLGISSNYTTSILSLEDYTQVQTHINASHDGTLKFEFINDAAGNDIVRELNIPYNASLGFQLYSAPCFTPYVRYSFTNTSGSAQTDMFYETRFLTKALNPQLLRADAAVSPAMVSELVRVANDPIVDVSRSLYTDKQVIHKFGIADETGSGDDIWANNTAVATYPWPTSAQNVVVVSASANDTSAGSGARTVIVEGLDTNWAQATETLTMSGATSVTGATAFVRVNRLYVDDCGTYGSANAGAITLTHETSGNTLAIIEADAGQSRQTMYSVPASYTAYIRRMDVTVQAGGTDDATVSAYRRPAADDTSAPMKAPRIFHTFSNLEGDAESEWFAMQSFAEKTDIWLTADAVSGTPDISATYDLILIKNDNPTAPQ